MVVAVLALALMPVLVLLQLVPGLGLGLVQLPVPPFQLSALLAQQQALPAGTAAMCFAGQALEVRLSGIHYISRHLPI